MEYLIYPTSTPPSLTGDWEGTIWQQAHIGDIMHPLPETRDFRPKVQFKMLYDQRTIYLIFRVEDRYVLSRATERNQRVCGDSCVELFIKPPRAVGYFNFESNCGGTQLCSYIEDPTRVGTGFQKFTRLPADEGELIKIYHSMPSVVDPEITEPTTWINELHIPFAIMEKYVGQLGDMRGQVWRGNLHKCGDDTSHPHWLTWAPNSKQCFHQPQFFDTLRFA